MPRDGDAKKSSRLHNGDRFDFELIGSLTDLVFRLVRDQTIQVTRDHNPAGDDQFEKLRINLSVRQIDKLTLRITLHTFLP